MKNGTILKDFDLEKEAAWYVVLLKIQVGVENDKARDAPNQDRLARNLADLLTIVQDLTGRGVSVTFLNERLSFESGKDASPTSKLMLSMIGAFAEFERSMIKHRQMEGIALAKERGVYKGRQRTVTEEQISKIRSLLDVGVPLVAATREVGVSRSTAYKYLNMSEGNCHD